jgi:hypothetical protein
MPVHGGMALYQHSIQQGTAIEARRLFLLPPSISSHFTAMGCMGRADCLRGIPYLMKAFWIS